MADFTPPSWTLRDIITETRSITGRPDVSMMSDADVVNFINYFYQYVMTKELKIFWSYTYHTFYTVPNQDQYTAPSWMQTLNPRVTCDGFGMEWYSDPDTFFEDYPEQLNRVIIASGDGFTNNFTFAIPAYPVLPRSLFVTDGVQIAQDNGIGGFVNPNNFYAALPGVIDYATGTVSGLVFLVAPAANVNITANSQTYIPARPQGILFYKTQPLLNSAGPNPPTSTGLPPVTLSTADSVNMFVLRPVPGLVHKIKMEGIEVPPPMINYTDVPFRIDLGPLIALGASLHIFKRFNQMDQYDQTMPEYQRFKDVCMQDTYELLLYQRSVPTF